MITIDFYYTIEEVVDPTAPWERKLSVRRDATVGAPDNVATTLTEYDTFGILKLTAAPELKKTPLERWLEEKPAPPSTERTILKTRQDFR